MARRLAIAALPVLAAAAVLTLVLGYTDRRPHVQPDAARAEPSAPSAPPAATVPVSHVKRPVLRPAPAQVRGSAAETMPIPILAYHVIGTPTPTTPNIQLWVRPAAFAAEMTALRHAGYWAITLDQMWRAWATGAPLPKRPVVVSFDDGYRGDYTHARPVLRQLGWPGVLNLELHDVGQGNLRASEVRGLIRSGWEIASHTISHPDLTTVTPSVLRYELVASRQQLLRRFGVRAKFFCYPYGRYNPAVEAAVHAAGYLAATTEDEGYATAASPYALRRVRVNGSDTPATLLAHLSAERPA